MVKPINRELATRVELVLEAPRGAAPARQVETKDEYHTADPIHRHNYEFLQGLCKLISHGVESFFVRLAATPDGELIDFADDTTGEIEFRGNVDRYGYVLEPIAARGIVNGAWLMQPARSVINPNYTVWPVTPIRFQVAR